MKKLALASGAVYIVAWVLGLAVASGGPKPNAHAKKVTTYFAKHEHSAMLGHLLVDGIAGLALLAVAGLIYRYFGRDGMRRLGRLAFYSTIAAAVVSLTQFAIGETFTYRAAHGGSPTNVRDLFVTLNDLDTVKIAFLALMILAISIGARRRELLPRWFVIYGYVTAPLLAISGFAFPLDSGPLLALLELSLLLLLLWAGIFCIQVARRTNGLAPQAAPATAT